MNGVMIALMKIHARYTKQWCNFKSEIVITNLDKSYHFFPYFASITNDYHEFILFNYLEKLPKWTLKYITGPGKNSFKGKKLSFESIPESPDGKIRYVDVLDESANPNIFYEFKSVKTVPPGKFQTQFLKDLSNATSLDEIKWIFDASKNPTGAGKSFYEAMKEAINGLNIPPNVLNKYGLSEAGLKTVIINNLNKIFLVN